MSTFLRKSLSTVFLIFSLLLALNLFINKSFGDLVEILLPLNHLQVSSGEHEQLYFKDCHEEYLEYLDLLGVELINEKRPLLSITQFEELMNLRKNYYQDLYNSKDNQKVFTYYTYKAEIAKDFGAQTLLSIMRVKSEMTSQLSSKCSIENML